MFDLQAQSDAFKLQYEKFLHACDALEETGEWEKAVRGDMESFYFNDLMCAVLHLISADGIFSDREAEYINTVFGFSYTPADLAEIYRTEGENIRKLFSEGIPEGYRRMKQNHPALAEHYKTMLLQLCDLIALSDGYFLKKEQQLLDVLKKELV